MKIIVCVKVVRGEYVGKTTEDGCDYVVNPYDMFALQSILEKRNKENEEVICMSMGGSNTEEALIKCLAYGADDVYWLKDDAFAGADTVATSYTISEGIKKMDGFSFVVCGERAVDGETAQTGIGIAQRLGIPCITDVEEILELNNGEIIVSCTNEKKMEILKVKAPAMVICKNITTIERKISLLSIKRAQKKEIHIWNAQSLNLDARKCGKKGSKTKVLEVKSIFNKKNGVKLEGDYQMKVDVLDKMLRKGN